MTSSEHQQLMDSIAGLLDSRCHCQCGRLHEVPTQYIIIAPGALDRLPKVLAELNLTGCSLLVADDNTYQAAGHRVTSILGQAGHHPAQLLIEPESGQPDVEATQEPVQLVEREAAGCNYLVAVGSGTINDIVKMASTRLDIPYIAIATAASMTGYPSGVAALRVGGLKRSIPATPPAAIIADIDVIAGAAPQMAAAGIADLVSRSPSSIDWRLAALLRGDYFCPRIAQIAEWPDRACRTVVAEVGQRDPEALAVLMAGLMLAGIAMKMAETSAPASGGGHLISHYWDMTAAVHARHRSLHGLQVAIGDLICTTLYEQLWPRLDQVDLAQIVADRRPAEEFACQTRQHYAPLIGQQAADQAVEAALSKYAEGEQLRSQLAPLSAEPDKIWDKLEAWLTPAEELRRIFAEGGIPTTAAALGIGETELVNAYHFASRLRARYTVLDLAHDLGLLDELRHEVLAEANAV